jgi:hypothetical protein
MDKIIEPRVPIVKLMAITISDYTYNVNNNEGDQQRLTRLHLLNLLIDLECLEIKRSPKHRGLKPIDIQTEMVYINEREQLECPIHVAMDCHWLIMELAKLEGALVTIENIVGI